MAMAAEPSCEPNDTRGYCRLDRIEEKVDKLLEMWFYPPPISYDGKQTWVRIDPSLARKMDELIAKKCVQQKEPSCRVSNGGTHCGPK